MFLKRSLQLVPKGPANWVCSNSILPHGSKRMMKTIPSMNICLLVYIPFNKRYEIYLGRETRYHSDWEQLHCCVSHHFAFTTTEGQCQCRLGNDCFLPTHATKLTSTRLHTARTWSLIYKIYSNVITTLLNMQSDEQLNCVNRVKRKMTVQ